MTENVNTEELLSALDNTTSELTELISSFNETQINDIPSAGSWTAAQVAEHVTKSNIAIIRSLREEGHSPGRPVDAGVEQLRKTFLDFDKNFGHLNLFYQRRTSIKRNWSSITWLLLYRN